MEEDFTNALSSFHQKQITSLKCELQRGKRAKLAHVTGKDKRVVQSESSLRAETTNANRMANSLIEKLGQCNGMFAKLLEMTNKHVEKYPGLFPEYHNLKQWEKGNKISNRLHKT